MSSGLADNYVELIDTKVVIESKWTYFYPLIDISSSFLNDIWTSSDVKRSGQ